MSLCTPPCRPCLHASRATPQPRWHASARRSASLHDVYMLAAMAPMEVTGGQLLAPGTVPQPPPQTPLDQNSTLPSQWLQLWQRYRRSCFGRACFSTPGEGCLRTSSGRLPGRWGNNKPFASYCTLRKANVVFTGTQAQNHGAAVSRQHVVEHFFTLLSLL